MPQTVLQAVSTHHATANTKLHALCALRFLNRTDSEVGHLYWKDRSTISRWLTAYRSGKGLVRIASASTQRKFHSAQRTWLFKWFMKNPTSMLDEAKRAFDSHWLLPISVPSVWRIIHEQGLTRKVRNTLRNQL